MKKISAHQKGFPGLKYTRECGRREKGAVQIFIDSIRTKYVPVDREDPVFISNRHRERLDREGTDLLPTECCPAFHPLS